MSLIAVGTGVTDSTAADDDLLTDFDNRNGSGPELRHDV